jgi:Holliday junction DNA helicase RuvA
MAAVILLLIDCVSKKNQQNKRISGKLYHEVLFANHCMLIFCFFGNMIAYIEGKFTHKSPTFVYIDVQGVGYELQISLHTYSAIQNLDSGRLYTHLQIREDAHVLYGFSDKSEKELFVDLVSVSGIGAATARMMLSSQRPDEIRIAIITGNTRLLEGIKGIGKKTAERLVLELKDKFAKQSTIPLVTTASDNRNGQEALIALATLGIARQQAENAVKKAILLNNSASVEELIKLALKNI